MSNMGSRRTFYFIILLFYRSVLRLPIVCFKNVYSFTSDLKHCAFDVDAPLGLQPCPTHGEHPHRHEEGDFEHCSDCGLHSERMVWGCCFPSSNECCCENQQGSYCVACAEKRGLFAVHTDFFNHIPFREGESPAMFALRINNAMKTYLLDCFVGFVTLPDGTTAICFSADDDDDVGVDSVNPKPFIWRYCSSCAAYIKACIDTLKDNGIFALGHSTVETDKPTTVDAGEPSLTTETEASEPTAPPKTRKRPRENDDEESKRSSKRPNPSQ